MGDWIKLGDRWINLDAVRTVVNDQCEDNAADPACTVYWTGIANATVLDLEGEDAGIAMHALEVRAAAQAANAEPQVQWPTSHPYEPDDPRRKGLTG